MAADDDRPRDVDADGAGGRRGAHEGAVRIGDVASLGVELVIVDVVAGPHALRRGVQRAEVGAAADARGAGDARIVMGKGSNGASSSSVDARATHVMVSALPPPAEASEAPSPSNATTTGNA